MANQESFYQRLFRAYHRNHRPHEVKPQTSGEALGLLKEYTEMTWEELARSIGMLPSTLALAVRRSSRLPIPVCEACKRLAGKHGFTVLEKWFHDLLMYTIRTRRKTKDDYRTEDRKYYDEIR